ncbi:MAG: iron-siderophore ABC transporter substrate-binding protein [Pelatocladus maniniholoensis HA4357-MV3]|jgi:iron complex transport system substrate-binding protein|uniref:Iron-siderophore ABC transporter substrate-binding protein n=1 Tax=Pelatocladus maniniholoensis HA4357-MV3 TaxID=1117104 RepID=A0A9E3HBF0_9NOST|nr:iron-siderophore ABC transporter substrate-binding protein [Pelatocladus maniniholoensis HA4357-MV3]BAZ70681.1 ABC transporter, iron(III) dicitrate-binding periplasmic protein [Fischerella sp. NIES-4106]
MKKVSRIIIIFIFASLTTFLFSTCNHKLTENTGNLGGLSRQTNCRIIQHLVGETCVPQNPQRIIALHVATLGNLLTLGVKPIGSATEFDKTEFPKYLESKIGGIEWVGGTTQPNLEKILKLKPDLIINLSDDQSIYPLLSKIAPTVQTGWEGPNEWKEHFSFVAKVLGREDTYQQAWDHYNQRIKELKVALGDRYQNQKFSYVYLEDSNNPIFISELKNVFAGSILNDAGLQRTEVQNVISSNGYLFIPEEELSKIDGDVVFIGIDEDSDPKSFNKIKQKPLWKTLKAVQTNHVYIVNKSTWRESNLIAADTVIDDLFKYLVDIP